MVLQRRLWWEADIGIGLSQVSRILGVEAHFRQRKRYPEKTPLLEKMWFV